MTISEDINYIEVTLDETVLKQLGYDVEYENKGKTNQNICLRKNGQDVTVLDIPATYNCDDKYYKITKIGISIFWGYSLLKSITIPSTITQIGHSAFWKCSSLTTVIIPESVTRIGDWAFSHCSSLTSITIPNSVTQIGDSAFRFCSSLVSVNIPESVTKIGNGIFSNCKSLTSVTIPNSVGQIGFSTFWKCSSLRSVNIPNGVTKIGKETFYHCRKLKNITIPNSVIEICDGAFSGCKALKNVTIPDSVKQIGENAFEDVSHIEYNGQATGFLFKNADVGDYVKFGNYPQMANGDSLPIEWLVLAKENNKILVISRYGLEARRFDSKLNDWKNSEIRQWLNADFYNKAFNANEKKLIRSSSISTTVYKGGFLGFGKKEELTDSDDYIFLLSKEEAEKYFANVEERKCKATEYAKVNGVLVADNGYSWWWLRSPSTNCNNYVYHVNYIGDICGIYSVFNDFVVARPALWINI